MDPRLQSVLGRMYPSCTHREIGSLGWRPGYNSAQVVRKTVSEILDGE